MSKKQLTNFLYWSAFAALGLYFSYSKGWIFSDFESISPRQAYDVLQKEDKITLLDVRSPEEFAQEHIEGSILIPLQVLSDTLPKLQSAKGNKILVYCHSGNRSVAAARILSKNGFIPINITGGISQWKSDGLSVTR